MMLKKEENGEVLKGNDKYEGFCKDLLEKISETLGIQCKKTWLWRKPIPSMPSSN
jgi:hypothetical protein